MEEERKKFEKLYQELNEEDTATKKWNQALIPKSIPVSYTHLTLPTKA